MDSRSNLYFAFKIKDGLFIGDCNSPNERDFILQNKISSVVNCASSQIKPNNLQIGLKYLNFDWIDSDDQIIIDSENNCQNIKHIFEFILHAHDQCESVLVCSQRGQSRALTVISSFLMKRYSWSLYKTLEFMNSKRSDFEIRATFLKQLLLYEQILFSQRECSRSWKDGDDIGADQEGKLVRNTYVNSQLICHESRTFYQKTLAQKKGEEIQLNNAKLKWAGRLREEIPNEREKNKSNDAIIRAVSEPAEKKGPSNSSDQSYEILQINDYPFEKPKQKPILKVTQDAIGKFNFYQKSVKVNQDRKRSKTMLSNVSHYEQIDEQNEEFEQSSAYLGGKEEPGVLSQQIELQQSAVDYFKQANPDSLNKLMNENTNEQIAIPLRRRNPMLRATSPAFQKFTDGQQQMLQKSQQQQQQQELQNQQQKQQRGLHLQKQYQGQQMQQQRKNNYFTDGELGTAFLERAKINKAEDAKLVQKTSESLQDGKITKQPHTKGAIISSEQSSKLVEAYCSLPNGATMPTNYGRAVTPSRHFKKGPFAINSYLRNLISQTAPTSKDNSRKSSPLKQEQQGDKPTSEASFDANGQVQLNINLNINSVNFIQQPHSNQILQRRRKPVQADSLEQLNNSNPTTISSNPTSLRSSFANINQCPGTNFLGKSTNVSNVPNNIQQGTNFATSSKGNTLNYEKQQVRPSGMRVLSESSQRVFNEKLPTEGNSMTQWSDVNNKPSKRVSTCSSIDPSFPNISQLRSRTPSKNSTNIQINTKLLPPRESKRQDSFVYEMPASSIHTPSNTFQNHCQLFTSFLNDADISSSNIQPSKGERKRSATPVYRSKFVSACASPHEGGSTRSSSMTQQRRSTVEGFPQNQGIQNRIVSKGRPYQPNYQVNTPNNYTSSKRESTPGNQENQNFVNYAKNKINKQIFNEKMF